MRVNLRTLFYLRYFINSVFKETHSWNGDVKPKTKRRVSERKASEVRGSGQIAMNFLYAISGNSPLYVHTWKQLLIRKK